jgi:hypothetical protein
VHLWLRQVEQEKRHAQRCARVFGKLVSNISEFLLQPRFSGSVPCLRILEQLLPKLHELIRKLGASVGLRVKQLVYLALPPGLVSPELLDLLLQLRQICQLSPNRAQPRLKVGDTRFQLRYSAAVRCPALHTKGEHFHEQPS